MADRSLPSCLRMDQASQVALTDPITDRLLSKSKMVEQLVADLMTRAQNNFYQDPVAKQQLDRSVSSIRGAGGHVRTVALYPTRALLIPCSITLLRKSISRLTR